MGAEPIIGELPTKWHYSTLSTLCAASGGNIQTGPFGSQLHASDYVSDGIPCVMPQNIGDNRINEQDIARITSDDANRLARHILRKGDIVYSRRGDVERRALVRDSEDGWFCGTGCLRIRLGADVTDSDWLAYYLGDFRVRAWIVRHAHGATMANLNTSILSALPVAVPPLSEQRFIAHILGTLDDKIELNRQMSATLDAMARALFESWFVRFDPVRAKAAGRDTGLPADIAALFPDSFEESEIGDVPKGWDCVPFSSTVDIIGGGTPKTSESAYWNGHIPWFSVVDAPAESDLWVVNTQKHITDKGLASSAARLLEPGTTIISARGTVGRVALVGAPMAMNQSCYGLRGLLGSTGLYAYYSTRDIAEELRQRAHGSVFDTITRDTLSSCVVVAPPKSVVALFEAHISAMAQRILGNVYQSKLLTQLRDTLLPKLISGELRVPDAERALATAGVS